MKSAFELAMERFGGDVQQFSTLQKEQLTEVERLYEAKIAQAKFAAESRLQACQGDPEKVTQIQADMAVEIRSLETRRERKKEDLRNEFKRA